MLNKGSIIIAGGVVVFGLFMYMYLVPGAMQMDMEGVQTQSVENTSAAPLETDTTSWKDFQKPAESVLKSRLSPLQFNVTQEEGTETPFHNEYWDNEEEGIYVDIVSGEPLFSSKDKYDSGTGWPSFTKPLASENIVEREDDSLFASRTEVRSLHGDSHLGHVFDDGPQPLRLRYCMNSAALRFVPKNKLVEEGYGEFVASFSK